MMTTTTSLKRMGLLARLVTRVRLGLARSALRANDNAHQNIQHELRALVQDRDAAATRCAQLRCRVAELELALQHGDFAAYAPKPRKERDGGFISLVE